MHATGAVVGKYKVEIIAERIRETATSRNFTVVPIVGKLNDEQILKEVLDCDVIFSCVDRAVAKTNYEFYCLCAPDSCN